MGHENKMILSENTYDRWINAQFEHQDISWIRSKILWCINSKYRRYKFLEKVYLDQLHIPDQDLQDLADDLRNRDIDKTVYNIEQWVIKNIKYEFDKGEEWEIAANTLLRRFGDCDDMNGMIYVLCRLAGVPDYALFTWLGDVQMSNGLEGHYALMYRSYKANKTVWIDSTYYPTKRLIKNRKAVELPDISSGYMKTWWIFNEIASWKMR